MIQERETVRTRINGWWLDLIRHLMGLRRGEYVILFTVNADGSRTVRVVSVPEKMF